MLSLQTHRKDLTALLLYTAIIPSFNYPLYPLLPKPVPSSWVQLQRSAASSVQYFYSFLLPLTKNKNKTTSAWTTNISPSSLFVICLYCILPQHQIIKGKKTEAWKGRIFCCWSQWTNAYRIKDSIFVPAFPIISHLVHRYTLSTGFFNLLPWVDTYTWH